MKIISRLAALLLSGAAVLSLAGCGAEISSPPADAATAPPAAAVSPSLPDAVTVFLPAADAGLLDDVAGARRIRDFTLCDAVAAEIPKEALADLSRKTAVTVAASFAAPPAVSTAADGTDPADLVLRAENPLAGDGTVIAVIDSAFDTDHPAFVMPENASPKITKEQAAAILPDTNAAHFGRAENTYVSDKIPFAYDYAGRDSAVESRAGDHGTHVAALAAGGGVRADTLPGAAPAAQLLLMKVFDDGGVTCSEADILCAVEDAVLLGADVINLSFGTLAVPAENASMIYLAEVIAEAEARGITVVAAAGNSGASGAGGAAGDLMRTDNPDTGLTAEPAVFPTVLGVGAAENAIVYAPFLRADGRRIRYSPAAEAETGAVPALSSLAGEERILLAVPGAGLPADYEGLDAAGKIVLVERGTISFSEKVQNAAEAGAAAVIVYNSAEGEDFRMSAPDTDIPAVSASREDGLLLIALDGTAVTVGDGYAPFPAADAREIASYSARGPAFDLTPSPDLAAVGADAVSAVTGGGYGVMSGTSMAAPQIAGLTAAYIADHRDYLSSLGEENRSAAVRAALMSAAVPTVHGDSGLPYSPRLQGAGVLAAGADTAEMSVYLMGDAAGAIALGDHLPGEGGTVRFTLSAVNAGTKTETVTLSACAITEGHRTVDGKSYVTETPAAFPAEITVSPKTVTLRPGASAEITVTLRPDPAFLTAQDAVFPSGFYLEGYVTAETEGNHTASLPYLGFCGNFDAAPLVDGGDWDGYESYYGLQNLYLVHDDGTFREAGEDSARFAFSPNGDGRADSVLWEIYPLRHIAACRIRILDGDGNPVCENAFGGAEKSHVTEGTLNRYRLPLWDGTDGLNSHFTWPDGRYRAEITFSSFGEGRQTVVIPLRIDTEAPAAVTSFGEGTVTVRAEDAGALYSLRIYGTDPEGEQVIFAATERRAESVTLTAQIPAGTEYVYVRAEDMAGNVTVNRLYTAAETEITGEEAAA